MPSLIFSGIGKEPKLVPPHSALKPFNVFIQVFMTDGAAGATAVEVRGLKIWFLGWSNKEPAVNLH